MFRRQAAGDGSPGFVWQVEANKECKHSLNGETL